MWANVPSTLVKASGKLSLSAKSQIFHEKYWYKMAFANYNETYFYTRLYKATTMQYLIKYIFLSWM